MTRLCRKLPNVLISSDKTFSYFDNLITFASLYKIMCGKCYSSFIKQVQLHGTTLFLCLYLLSLWRCARYDHISGVSLLQDSFAGLRVLNCVKVSNHVNTSSLSFLLIFVCCHSFVTLLCHMILELVWNKLLGSSPLHYWWIIRQLSTTCGPAKHGIKKN